MTLRFRNPRLRIGSGGTFLDFRSDIGGVSWILASGYWDDLGVWDDAELWVD